MCTLAHTIEYSPKDTGHIGTQISSRQMMHVDIVTINNFNPEHDPKISSQEAMFTLYLALNSCVLHSLQ